MKAYFKRAKELFDSGVTKKSEIAKIIKKEYDIEDDVENIRKYISKELLTSRPNRALEEACDDFGIPIEKVGHYWYKGKHISIHASNKSVMSYEDIRDEIVKSMDKHSPGYAKIERMGTTDGHLLVLDPADVHIGKLCTSFETGEEYDSQIAVTRVKEGVNGILEKIKGFNIDQVVLVAGNDILHVDTPKRTTTAGTSQDTDGMWYTNFLIAKKLYVDIIETLVSVAPVHFVYNPSNHDYMNGFFLADVIKSWFRNCPDVTFDCSISHRKYYRYHNNLIGTTHGDGAKNQDLPLLMAQEAPNEWAGTNHRYVYTHHVHHKTSKDYIGVTVESMRSPSGTDSWHHRNGYQHSPKAVEGFIHCKSNGQIARITHLF